MTMPTTSKVQRTVLIDPLRTLPVLLTHAPEFKPMGRLIVERLPMLELNKSGYLSPEEEKLFTYIMAINNDTLAFDNSE